jgi:hypothetical protein
VSSLKTRTAAKRLSPDVPIIGVIGRAVSARSALSLPVWRYRQRPGARGTPNERQVSTLYGIPTEFAARFAAEQPKRVVSLTLANIASGHGRLPPAERKRLLTQRFDDLSELGAHGMAAKRGPRLLGPEATEPTRHMVVEILSRIHPRRLCAGRPHAGDRGHHGRSRPPASRIANPVYRRRGRSRRLPSTWKSQPHAQLRRYMSSPVLATRSTWRGRSSSTDYEQTSSRRVRRRSEEHSGAPPELLSYPASRMHALPFCSRLPGPTL